MELDYAVSNVRVAVNSKLRRTGKKAVTAEVKHQQDTVVERPRKITKHLSQESGCLRKYSKRRHVENKAEALAVGPTC